MAENNQTQSTLDSYKYDTAASGMEKYRETAVAFDNLIVQVGRAIAAAQQNMDENQVLFQRQVAKALQEIEECRAMMNCWLPAGCLYLHSARWQLSLSMVSGLLTSYPSQENSSVK